MAQNTRNTSKNTQPINPSPLLPGATQEAPIMDETIKTETGNVITEHNPVTGETVTTIKQPNWFVRGWRSTSGWFKRMFRKAKHGTTRAANATGRGVVVAYDWSTIRLAMLGRSIWNTGVFIISYIVLMPVRLVRNVWTDNSASIYESKKAGRQISRRERKREQESARRQAAAAARSAAGEARKQGRVPSPATV